MTTSHLTTDPERHPHPGVVFSKMRAMVWERFATDEDFFVYVDGLRAIYAKRKYKGDGDTQDDIFDKDFKKWKGEQPIW